MKTNSFINSFKQHCCSIVFGACALAGIANAADWPHWRGPDYNGISKETGWLDSSPDAQITVVWQKPISAGCSSVVVRGDRLYTMSNPGVAEDEKTHRDIVYCLDAATGSVIWEQSYPCGLNFKSNTPPGPFATPAISGDVLYTCGRAGDVHCMNLSDGKILWHRNLKTEMGFAPPFNGGFSSSPLVWEDLVIVNAGLHGLALDKKDGKTVWASSGESSGMATPVPYRHGGRNFVALFTAEGIEGIDPRAGKHLWSFPWVTKYKSNAADPVVFDGKVFIGAYNSEGCALVDFSGEKPVAVWKNQNLENHYAASILWQGHLYGFDITALKCVEFSTGQTKWALEEGSGLNGRGSLIMADGKLILLSEKGVLAVIAATPEKFSPILQKQILETRCYTPPTLANGKIYVRNARGDLACVVIRGERKSKSGN